jgi:Mg2+/citrate symporter
VLPEVQSVVTGVILVEVSLITLAGPLKTRKRIIVDLIQVTFNTYHKIQVQNYTFLSIIFLILFYLFLKF